MATQLIRPEPIHLHGGLRTERVHSDLAEMLDAVRTACDAQQAMVVAVDEATQQVARIAGSEPDGEDDWGEGAAFPSDDAPLLASDVMELASADLLDAVPRRASDRLALRLSNRGRQRLYLLLHFRSEIASSRARALHLLPKLTRALARMLDLETRQLNSERERAAAAAALDQSQCGVVAATADGRPIVMNEAASILLAQEEGLQLRRGLIRPTNHVDAVRFQAALDTASPQGVLRDGDSRPAVVMLLRGRNQRAPLIVTVAPAGTAMAPPTAADPEEEEAAVIIHLARPEPDAGCGVEPICHLLGLSRVETRLVDELYRGQTLTEAAGTMRIKVDTARGYLKQIFNKTDTHRQTDLLALVARYCRAVRGRFSFRSL